MRIAFYAPLKAPNHPNPSGDRRMARLINAALSHAGHDVHIASTLRAYDGRGNQDHQVEIKREAETEVERILAGDDDRPDPGAIDAWFTYHVYYKAPDWIGPAVSRALSIPYFTAELSYAEKRADGPWAFNHVGVREALETGDRHFCFTATDLVAIERFLGGRQRIVRLPPFTEDVPEYSAADVQDCREALRRASGFAEGVPVLLAVGMMRPGDKLESYRMLAAALGTLNDLDWGLVIVGDGDAAADVRQAFASLPSGRAYFAGQVAGADLWRYYCAADCYVWPAHNEAYGMAFLEAQSCGLPVVAQATRGVPDVVRDGETGLLTPEGSIADFAAAMRRMIEDETLRNSMSTAARAFIAGERTIPTAARILDHGIGSGDPT